MSQTITVTTIAVSPEQLAAMIAGAVEKGQSRPENARKTGKRLLSPKAVAEEYGFGERQLEHWRSEGVGPVYTTAGRRVYYERAVLDEFIAGGRVQTTGKAV